MSALEMLPACVRFRESIEGYCWLVEIMTYSVNDCIVILKLRFCCNSFCYLNYKLSNQKARFVPRNHSIYDRSKTYRTTLRCGG